MTGNGEHENTDPLLPRAADAAERHNAQTPDIQKGVHGELRRWDARRSAYWLTCIVRHVISTTEAALSHLTGVMPLLQAAVPQHTHQL